MQEEEDKIKEALFLSSSPSPTKQEPPAPCLSPPPPTLDNSQQEEQGDEDESDVMEVENRVQEEEDKEDISEENEEEPVVASAAPVTTSMQEVEVNAEQEISASENSSSSSSNDQSQATALEQPAADSGDVAVTKTTTQAEEVKTSVQMLPAMDDEGLSEKESSGAKEDVVDNSLDGLLGLSEAALASLGREELISALRSLASEQLRLGKEQQRLALRQGQIGDFMVRICSAMDQL